MKGLLAIVLITVQAAVLFAQQPAAEKTAHFRTVDVYVDSKTQPLAAYQLELSVKGGNARIVGVEGGEHPAFKEAPRYDPKAIQQERVVMAAFNTASADNLPKGRTRVATIHLQVAGEAEPQFTLKLKAAANSTGKKSRSRQVLEKGKRNEYQARQTFSIVRCTQRSCCCVALAELRQSSGGTHATPRSHAHRRC